VSHFRIQNIYLYFLQLDDGKQKLLLQVLLCMHRTVRTVDFHQHLTLVHGLFSHWQVNESTVHGGVSFDGEDSSC
jgi:hypothetical protein